MPKKAETPKKRSVIELSADEARAFFLKGESYFTTDLPSYFRFDGLLSETADVMGGKNHRGFQKTSPRPWEVSGVNHQILTNKDGRYAWRPLELIHPAMYVSLVNSVMSDWDYICGLFRQFRGNSIVECLSLPVESLTKEKDKAEQVIQWWQEVEQKSIELSLDYEYMFQSDVSDCYTDIYTHSIAWALHTKEVAKNKRRDRSLIGNIIDGCLQDMRQGQTNGIPQGAVLMDFIAEIVLGYSDVQLSKRIGSLAEGYRIIRYRDDYRIFVNSQQHGEYILKCLAEVMIDLGLKLNPLKTQMNDGVVRSSIKSDKLHWMFRKQGDQDLQKHLLIIHNHGIEHPNSGSLRVALRNYYKRLLKTKKCNSPWPLIAIVSDIAYRNPGTYPWAAAILSKLLSFLGTAHEQEDAVKRISGRFSKIPNTGHLDIWLQRISHSQNLGVHFAEPLCQLINPAGSKAPIWNNEWVSSPKLLGAIDARKIVDAEILKELPPVISPGEVELFRQQYY